MATRALPAIGERFIDASGNVSPRWRAWLQKLDGALDALETLVGAGSYQPLDATLTALAGLATGASKVPYSTGTDVFSQLDLDTDGTLAANSDTKLATQKAVKTYADTRGWRSLASGSFSSTAVSVTGLPAGLLSVEYTGVSHDNGSSRSLLLRGSVDNGSNYLSTTTSAYSVTTGTVTNRGTSSLLPSVSTLTSAQTWAGAILIANAGGYARTWGYHVENATGYLFHSVLPNASPVNALQFLLSGAGNFDAGTYAIKGTGS